MAQGRKYTNLPDLDTSPDIYESQDAGTDAALQSSSSPASPHPSDISADSETATTPAHLDDADALKPSRISHRGVSTSHARLQFADSQVDARDVDFSGRITNGRKSYRVPLKTGTRKRKVKRGDDGYVDELDFDSGDEETFEERVARLKREVEEVKVQAEKNNTETVNGDDHGPDTEDGVFGLSEMLNALQAQTRAVSARRPMANGRHANEAAPNNVAARGNGLHVPIGAELKLLQEFSTPDLDRILSKATAFERRLTALENSLGLPTVASIQINQPPPPSNVLTTLSKLDSQMSTLASATLPSLENLSAQMSALTTSASQLAEARTSARQAQEALLKSPGGTPKPLSAPIFSPRSSRPAASTSDMPSPGSHQTITSEIDPETSQKVNELHNALSSITALSPLLPSVLDRLKSLRVLHADAATVSERFGETERLQVRLGGEIDKWKDALDKLEERVDEFAKVEGSNKDIIGGWVRDLGSRVDKLDQ